MLGGAMALWLSKDYFMPTINVGDQAPHFELASHSGKSLKLADYLGKQVVVLYFYPRDNTPGCTTQACSFRDAYEDFVKAGAVVI
ncbi:MAG: redoxin domain-containing protein, partial [Planctomycetaceae bacterium]|nr:redoxin domain-containing protein [Planctomycetaceae bacterium]